MLGQKLYTSGDRSSLANMDRQIFRIIGKATSLAAYVQPPPRILRISSALLELKVATGWPIVSAKAVSLSYLRQGSRIPDSASLAVPPCPQLFDVVGQVLVPDGSSWPRELQAVSRARKGSRRAVSSTRRPRTQRELHHGTSDRQLIGRPIFCYRVSGFSDSLGGEADMKIIALNRAGCASL